MPQQTSGTELRPDLYELALNFDALNAQRGYVWNNIMPLASVGRQSGPFPSVSAKESMRAGGETLRAPRAGYGRGFSEFGSDTYTTKEHGWEEVVDDTFEELYTNYVDAEEMAVSTCNLVLGQAQEIRTRDVVYAQSANAVATPWSTGSSATPRQDIRDARRSVQLKVGAKPNLLVITEKKMQDVLDCAEYLDNAKNVVNTAAMSQSEQLNALRNFFDIPQIVIADGIYDANGEGEAFAGDFIWDDDKAFLAVTGSTIAGAPKFGLTLEWSGDSASGVETYREENVRGTVYRVRHHRGEKVMSADCGWLLSSL